MFRMREARVKSCSSPTCEGLPSGSWMGGFHKESHLWCLNTHITPRHICPASLGVLEEFCHFCIVCSHSCFSIPSTLLSHSPSSLCDWCYSPAATAFSPWEVCPICWCSWIVYWMWHEASCNAITLILQWHGLFRQGRISMCYAPAISYRNVYFLSWDFSDA